MHRQNITIAQKAAALAAVLISVPAFAQYGAPPPAYPPGELERLVSRIALYPDPLLAQLLAAATYADQIPDAASWDRRWVNRTTYVHPYEVQRYNAPRVEERHEVRERPREVRERERPGSYRDDDRRR